MAIQCPYCMHLMEVKGAKPGRFTPRCASCKGKFTLVVPADAHAAPTVAAIAQTTARLGEQLPDHITAALGIEKVQARTGAMNTSAAVTALPSSSSLRGDVAGITAPPTVASMAIPAARGDSNGATLAPTAADERAHTLHLDPPATGPQDAPARDDCGQLRGTLGGYQIINRLGQGGMGAVYLARQLSLDRNVAMKVLLEQLAEDPQFIARFTREAYAAAQLTHHNMVHIHDIGAQKQTHFFSMEFVEGQTLAQLVRDGGRLDPEVAVGYVLQAARGLKFAHDHGMVHRDVKPDNLMLNVHGIVKVADLGLVKTAEHKHDGATQAKAAAAAGNWYDAGATQLNISMGTPAYMPPEQATDAATVDHRADIYSLGCTLYTLLVGRPPFAGKTAMDMITKHMKEPITPPSAIDDHIPQSLSRILLTMVAKRPQDRYQTMGDVIGALEEFLGTDGSGPFSPGEEQVRALESCVSWFNGSSWAKQRTRLIRAFVPLSALLLAVALFVPVTAGAKLQWAGGVLGFVLLTPLFYLLISGVTQKTCLMLKVRELIFGSRLLDWLTWLVGSVLLVGVLVALNWHLMWLAFAIAGAIVAGLFHFTIDPLVQRQRTDPVLQAEALLKKMRSRATPEAALQQFVCKYGGEQWEPFYEAMFGFESKLLARERWGKGGAIGRGGTGDRGRPRPKHAAWREPIIAWIDAKQTARRAARERKHIAALEHASLKAKGYSDTAARKKADRVAETLVMNAAEMRQDARAAAMETAPPPPTLPPGRREKTSAEMVPEQTAAATKEAATKRKKMLDDEGLEGFEHLSYFQRRYGGWAGLFLGPGVRFVLGAVLLAGCAVWAKQNNLFRTETLATVQNANLIDGMNADGRIVADATAPAAQAAPTKPLDLPILPRPVTRLFDGWGPGVAGAMLLLSALFSGPSLGLFIVPAALVTFAGGKFGLPSIGRVPPEGLAIILGLVGATAGFMLARK